LVCHEWELPPDIAAAIHAQNEPESDKRPDPVFYVSSHPLGEDESWDRTFMEQVLGRHDLSSEALDRVLKNSGEKARELVRLLA
jgi:hypothetical protein